jgi:hypothetical protein
MNTKEKEKRNTRSLSNRETLSRTVRRSFSFFGERGPYATSKTKHPNVSRKQRFLLIFSYFLSILSLSFRKKRGLAPFPLNLPFDYATLSCPYPISFSRVALRLWNRFITFTTDTYKHICYTFSTLAKLHKIGCLTRK